MAEDYLLERRDVLGPRLGQWLTFYGTIGERRPIHHDGEYVLVYDIEITNSEDVLDHLWLPLTRALARLRPGDQIHARGRVASYWHGDQISYDLTQITLLAYR